MAERIEDSSSDEETLMNEDELQIFTTALDEFKPAIPETVTKYYMTQCGVQTEDDRVIKLLSASVQKFMTDIINDCFQLHKIREKSSNKQAAASSSAANSQPTTTEAATSADQSGNSTSTKKPTTSTNQTLTLNDLTYVLGEYGINVKKTFFYT